MNFLYLTGEVGKLGIARIGKHIVSSSNAVVYDTFTGSDGTLLSAHTPDICPVGSAWAATPGTAEIRSNRASFLSIGAPGWMIASINSGLSNCVISSILNIGGASNGGAIAFRIQDSLNLWIANIAFSVGTLTIRDIVAGTITIRASIAVPFARNTDYLTLVTLSGNDIAVTIGAATINYASSFLASRTSHGLYTGSGAAAMTWDNFAVTSL